MSEILVFLPSRSPGEDPALDNAVAVGRWAADRLEADRHALTRLEGEEARRDRLEAGGRWTGLVAAGHGDPWTYFAHQEAALDRDNAGLLAGRWAWVYACSTGIELAHVAIDAGAAAYAGYTTVLYVEWSLDALPAPLAERLLTFLTEAPIRLAAGERDGGALRRYLGGLADELLTEIAEHHPDEVGAAMAVQQAYQNFVLRSAAPPERQPP